MRHFVVSGAKARWTVRARHRPICSMTLRKVRAREEWFAPEQGQSVQGHLSSVRSRSKRLACARNDPMFSREFRGRLAHLDAIAMQLAPHPNRGAS